MTDPRLPRRARMRQAAGEQLEPVESRTESFNAARMGDWTLHGEMHDPRFEKPIGMTVQNVHDLANTGRDMSSLGYKPTEASHLGACRDVGCTLEEHSLRMQMPAAHHFFKQMRGEKIDWDGIEPELDAERQAYKKRRPSK